MYRHILIPTDGSELAEQAVTNGLALAKSVGAKVTVIIVEEPIWLGAPSLAEDGALEELGIATAADRDCDLIVMATHGHGGLSAVLLGSVTNKVLTHTKIPVSVCY
jgi:nucleotide-binding universal stress UspA family protein